jgi:hypothetical protein
MLPESVLLSPAATAAFILLLGVGKTDGSRAIGSGVIFPPIMATVFCKSNEIKIP